jgi:hypothetical protein
VPREVVVHPLAAATPPESLSGADVVVIDVLRASTTLVHALAAGASEVIVCRDVTEVREETGSCHRGALLGGERLGLRVRLRSRELTSRRPVPREPTENERGDPSHRGERE